MKPTVCSHCGEKILTHWTVCPICAHPSSLPAITPGAPASGSEFIASLKNIYCVQCKAIVSPDAQICSACHVLIVRRYCSGCSRLVPDQAEFCPYCATSASAKKSRFRSLAKSALIFAVPLCVISAFILVVYRVSHEPTVPSPATGTLKKRATEPPPVATIVPADVEQKTIETPREIVPPGTEQNTNEEPESSGFSSTEVQNETNAGISADPTLTPVIQPEPKPQAEPETNIDSSRGARLLQGRKLTKHASLLMQKGRYSDASIVLRNALTAFPSRTSDLSYGEALYKLGICLRKKGAPDQAIPVLRQALRFPYYRTKALREVEAATSQLKKLSRVSGR